LSALYSPEAVFNQPPPLEDYGKYLEDPLAEEFLRGNTLEVYAY
jgi:hypothetical protein